MKYPNLYQEKKLWRKGFKRIACLDEAGRGSLAGPVVAAAAMIKRAFKKSREKLWISDIHNLGKVYGLRDSKRLSLKKREEIFEILKKNKKIEWGIGWVSEKVIDKINILNATKLAMKRAIKNLEKKLPKISPLFRDREKVGIVDFLILDGNFKLDLKIPQKSIKRADEKVFSCAIASIIAKVTRDKIMKRYAKKFPKYSFERHKGYPTPFHLKALKKYGPCKIHRKSFLPVKTCYNYNKGRKIKKKII